MRLAEPRNGGVGGWQSARVYPTAADRCVIFMLESVVLLLGTFCEFRDTNVCMVICDVPEYYSVTTRIKFGIGGLYEQDPSLNICFTSLCFYRAQEEDGVCALRALQKESCEWQQNFPFSERLRGLRIGSELRLG